MVNGKSLLCSAGGSPVSKVLLANASFPASEDELSLFLGQGPIFGLPCYLLPLGASCCWDFDNLTLVVKDTNLVQTGYIDIDIGVFIEFYDDAALNSWISCAFCNVWVLDDESHASKRRRRKAKIIMNFQVWCLKSFVGPSLLHLAIFAFIISLHFSSKQRRKWKRNAGSTIIPNCSSPVRRQDEILN